ncbi:hypothetical protein [Vibrio sp. WXL103]|uniref:hypothetical protein n=1 Tax=unclassified Vibrio TaxID=2614977 RepID=UPI003EC915B9
MLKKTIVGSFLYVNYYKGALLKVTILPITLSILLELALFSVDNELLTTLGIILLSFLYVVVAINVHKLVLNGVESVPKWGRFTLGQVEIAFIGHSLCLVLALISSGVAVVLLASLVQNTTFIQAVIFVGMLALYVIMCRLCVIFPAIAMEHALTFRQAWQLTRGKSAYMFAVVGVYPVILGLLISPLLTSGLPHVVVNLVSNVVMILTVTSLSLAYKELVESNRSECLIGC